MTFVAREIQLDIGIRKSDGLGRRIDRMDELRPSAHGIDRESSGVTEHVEHLCTMTVFLKKRAVVTLIHEKSGLLALKPVDVELQTIFNRYIRIKATYYIVIDRIKARFERKCRLRLIIYISDTGVRQTG